MKASFSAVVDAVALDEGVAGGMELSSESCVGAVCCLSDAMETLAVDEDAFGVTIDGGTASDKTNGVATVVCWAGEGVSGVTAASDEENGNAGMSGKRSVAVEPLGKDD